MNILILSAFLQVSIAQSPPSDAVKLATEVERRYVRLAALMETLVEVLESAQDTGRLQLAARRSRDLKIVSRMQGVRELLTTRVLEDALVEEKLLERDLIRVLRILNGEDEGQGLRDLQKDINSLTKALRRLKEVQKRAEESRDQTRSLEKKTGKDALSPEAQKKLSDRLERKLKRTKEDIKELQRSLARLQKKLDKKRQEQQQRASGAQQQQQQQSPQSLSKKKRNREQEKREELESLEKAARKMQEALQRLEAKNPEGSSADQEKSLAQLKKAEEEVEKQIEELEELKRADLLDTALKLLKELLSDQTAISNDTRAVEDARSGKDSSASVSGGDAERAADRTRSLARRERAMSTDADEVLTILIEDNSSVIAPSILERVIDDLDNVATRLDSAKSGKLTQLLQADIENGLEDLITALEDEKAKKEKKVQANGGGSEGNDGRSGNPGQKKPKSLFNPVKELKLLRNIQRRVRRRTEELDRMGLLRDPTTDAANADGDPDEQPISPSPQSDDDVNETRLDLEQLRRIARAQQDLADHLNALIKKYPQIDRFLLGVQDEAGDDDSEGDTGAPEVDTETPEATELNNADDNPVDNDAATEKSEGTGPQDTGREEPK